MVSAVSITILNCSIPLQRIDQERTLDIVGNETKGETESQTKRLTRSQTRNMMNGECANFISLQDNKRKIRKGLKSSSNDKPSANNSVLGRDENICPNTETTKSKRKRETADNERNINLEIDHVNKKRKIVVDSTESVRTNESKNQ